MIKGHSSMARLLALVSEVTGQQACGARTKSSPKVGYSGASDNGAYILVSKGLVLWGKVALRNCISCSWFPTSLGCGYQNKKNCESTVAVASYTLAAL